MVKLLLALLVIDAILIIISILLQPRSQYGIGSTFGGGGYATELFGGRGGMAFLTKVTAVLSIIFLILIFALNHYLASPSRPRPMMEREAAPTVPMTPEQAAPGQGQPAAPTQPPTGQPAPTGQPTPSGQPAPAGQ